MKKILKGLFAGVFIPIAFASTFYDATVSVSKKVDLPDNNRPYIVQVYDWKGEKIEETSGRSRSLDPFLIAKELNLNPEVEDKFSVFPNIDLGIGGKISIFQAPTYDIIDGKRSRVARSWQKKVGDLLSEQKIELGSDDKINFSVDTNLENQMEIRIVRVAITTVTKTEAIEYKTIKKEDKTLDEGKTRIERKGESGVRTLFYEVRREDGEEISRKLVKTEITEEPVDEILIIGTKPVITVRCKYNDIVLAASNKYGVKPNEICNLMMKESNGNANSVGNHNGVTYYGLFQYEPGFWASASSSAGYAGASYYDPTAQIYTTCWAWSQPRNRSRW